MSEDPVPNTTEQRKIQAGDTIRTVVETMGCGHVYPKGVEAEVTDVFEDDDYIEFPIYCNSVPSLANDGAGPESTHWMHFRLDEVELVEP